MDYTIVNMEELPRSEGSSDFEGYRYGGAGVSIILVDMAPGEGPKLHKHPNIPMKKSLSFRKATRPIR